MEVTYNATHLQIDLLIIVAFNLNNTIISPKNYISSLCLKNLCVNITHKIFDYKLPLQTIMDWNCSSKL